MKKIINYFLQGVLYAAPIGITVFILVQLFYLMDNILNEPIRNLLQIDFPGFGIILMITLLVLIGMLGQSIFANPFKRLFTRIVERTPFLRLIYSTINDLIKAVVGNDKKFDKPVLVTMNVEANIKKIGFLTREQLDQLGQTEMVAVYFPHSYNFSGELFIVPKSNIENIDINSSTMLKFVVSGGVSSLSAASTSHKTS
jgi:uncharacterized membrane protein